MGTSSSPPSPCRRIRKRSADPAPYQYVEIIEINDPDGFAGDVSTDVMARVAAEFREFADNPVFMLSETVDEE